MYPVPFAGKNLNLFSLDNRILHLLLGFDLDHVPLRPDLVDMYTMVVSTWVGSAILRDDLVVVKFVPGAIELGPLRVWVERYAKHIASVVARPTATLERTGLAIVWKSLAIEKVSLVVTKASLAVAKFVLAIARVLE